MQNKYAFNYLLPLLGALAALVETSSNLNKELILAIIIFVIAVTIGIGGIFSLFCNSYMITALLIFTVTLIGNAVFFSSGLYPLGKILRLFIKLKKLFNMFIQSVFFCKEAGKIYAAMVYLPIKYRQADVDSSSGDRQGCRYSKRL